MRIFTDYGSLNRGFFYSFTNRGGVILYCLRHRVFDNNITFCPANSDSYIFSIRNSEQIREAGFSACAQSIIKRYLHFFSRGLSCAKKCFSHQTLKPEKCYSNICGMRWYRIATGGVSVNKYELIESSRRATNSKEDISWKLE